MGVKAVRSKRFGTAGPPAGKRFCPYWKGKACGGRFLPADPARRRHAGAGAPVVRLRRKACGCTDGGVILFDPRLKEDALAMPVSLAVPRALVVETVDRTDFQIRGYPLPR